MNAFDAHAQGLAQLETETLDVLDGEARGGAVLVLFGKEMPCTHSAVLADFDLVPGGQSPATVIEGMEFRAAHLGASQTPRKGLPCSVRVNPTAAPLAMKLWSGGLLPGGQVYRFMLVDANYHA